MRDLFFRLWYWYISTVDKNADVTFMNYGFSKDDQKLELDEKHERDRYSVQLYDYVAAGADISGKEILEVGCGRGGGLNFVAHYHSPKTATGLDLNLRAVEFCQNHYGHNALSFVQGNAQSLSFPDSSFDVVINVESSHRYPQVSLFFNEVYRVLRPDGCFLFSDFRHKKDLGTLDNQLKDAGFVCERNELITNNVLEALNLSNSERIALISKLAPRYLRGLGKKFAATEGTPTYNKFQSREFEYFYRVMRKNNQKVGGL